MTLQGLQAQQVTKPCYSKLEVSHEEILGLLKHCYNAEVTRCGSQCTEQLEELEIIAKWLNISNPKMWLIIYGVVGNGKSTTARSIIRLYDSLKATADAELHLRGWEFIRDGNTATEQRYRRISALPTPKMVSAQDLSRTAKEDKSAFESLMKEPILIIDDVGIEATKVLNYGTEISPLAEVLFHRYDRRAVTIMTTNDNFEKLSATYGERIADRIREMASRVAYKEPSYRGR